MKKYYALPVLAFILTASVIYLLYGAFEVFTKDLILNAYSEKLQVPLFTGFLTISGFLLSLTTFIVVKMHEAVYQDKDYYERVERLKRIDPNYSQTKPLENLSSFLLVSVVISLLASFSQFTIGNYVNLYMVMFCISLAACASVFVLTSCVLIKKNITAWINFMKLKKEKERLNTEAAAN